MHYSSRGFRTLGRILLGLGFFSLSCQAVQAREPVWTLSPLDSTHVVLSANEVATVRYQLTNQSARAHQLVMRPLLGVTQLTNTSGSCGKLMRLAGHQSCVLTLSLNGSVIKRPILQGPEVCEQGGRLQCYQPSAADSLQVIPSSTPSQGLLSLNPQSLSFVVGTTGTVTLTNASPSTAVSQLKIIPSTSALTVVPGSSTCGTSLPAQSSCTLVFTANTVLPNASVLISSSNSNTLQLPVSVEQALISAQPVQTTFGANFTTQVTISNSSTSVRPATNIQATIPAGSPISVSANTCTPSLAIGQQCTITFTSASRTPPTDILIQGSDTNAQTITLTVKEWFAYVANGSGSGANSITRCQVLANGDFNDCDVIATGFNNPFDITFNAAGNLAYVSNDGNNTVQRCLVDESTGALSSCLATGTTFDGPRGFFLDEVNNRLYVSNFNNSTISVCYINPDNGLLSSCESTGLQLVNPEGIVFNRPGALAYITNWSSSNITRCEVGEDRLLENCNPMLFAGGNNGYGITINALQNTAYVARGPSLFLGSVYRCPIEDNGYFGTCVLQTNATLGDTSRFIVLNPNETLAYIANALSDNVSKCQIDSVTGDLSDCTFTGTNMNGATGIQLVLQ